MRIAGIYSFNNGKEVIEKDFHHLFEEVKSIIENVHAQKHMTKISKEKTMVGKRLYSPRSLNKVFEREFKLRSWKKVRVKCDYPNNYYVGGFEPSQKTRGAFREMDFVKEKVGVEIQFGKYSFMVYNVSAKMTIFHKLGYIDVGIEIVPLKTLADNMSTGVSFFEQFIWDLEYRGVSDIDIPVLILGIVP